MVLFSDHNADNFFIGESHWFNHQTAQVINKCAQHSAQTIPSLAQQLFCIAISTALKALDTTDRDFHRAAVGSAITNHAGNIADHIK